MSELGRYDRHLDPPCPDACPRCGHDLYRGQDPESCDCRFRECASCRKRIRKDEADGIGRCSDCQAEDCRKCPRCGVWRCAAEFGREFCADCEF